MKKLRDFTKQYLMPTQRLFSGPRMDVSGQDLVNRSWAMCMMQNPLPLPQAASTNPGGLSIPNVDGEDVFQVPLVPTGEFLAYLVEGGHVIADFNLRPLYFTTRPVIEVKWDYSKAGPYDEFVQAGEADIPFVTLPHNRPQYTGWGTTHVKFDGYTFDGQFNWVQQAMLCNFGNYDRWGDLVFDMTGYYYDDLQRFKTKHGLFRDYIRVKEEHRQTIATFYPNGEDMGGGLYHGATGSDYWTKRTRTTWEISNVETKKRIIPFPQFTQEAFDGASSVDLPPKYQMYVAVKETTGTSKGQILWDGSENDMSYLEWMQICNLLGFDSINHGNTWWKDYIYGRHKSKTNDLMLYGGKLVFATGSNYHNMYDLLGNLNWQSPYNPDVIRSAKYRYGIQMGTAKDSTSKSVEITCDDKQDHYILEHRALGDLKYCSGFGKQAQPQQ